MYAIIGTHKETSSLDNSVKKNYNMPRVMALAVVICAYAGNTFQK